jgi:hypothetical protein
LFTTITKGGGFATPFSYLYGVRLRWQPVITQNPINMIKFKKSEMFSFNGGTYVIKTLAYKLLETRAAQRTFDKANSITHPTKGEMVLVPNNVKFEISK